MKLKGWIEKDVFKYISCTLEMKYGKIHEAKFENQPPLTTIHYNSIISTDFEFEKHYNPKKAPYRSNYLINYSGGSKQPLIIFLKLTPYQVFKIKWQLKKYLIQDKSWKLTIFGAILGIFGTLITQKISSYITPPKNPATPQRTQTFDQINDQIELQTDSTLLKKSDIINDLNVK